MLTMPSKQFSRGEGQVGMRALGLDVPGDQPAVVAPETDLFIVVPLLASNWSYPRCVRYE
jgi:hypothetical protein